MKIKIVAGIVPAVIFILALLVINFWWRHHRRQPRFKEQQEGTWDPHVDHQDYTVEPFPPHPGLGPAGNGLGLSIVPSPPYAQSPLSEPESMTVTAVGSRPVTFQGPPTTEGYFPTGTFPSSATGSQSNIHYAPGTSEDGHSLVPRKSIEARSEQSHASMSARAVSTVQYNSNYLSPHSSQYPSRTSQLPEGASPPVTPGSGMEQIGPAHRPSIIVQHADAGSFDVRSLDVQEVPPPYANRTVSARDSVDANETHAQ